MCVLMKLGMISLLCRLWIIVLCVSVVVSVVYGLVVMILLLLMIRSLLVLWFVVWFDCVGLLLKVSSWEWKVVCVMMNGFVLR